MTCGIFHLVCSFRCHCVQVGGMISRVGLCLLVGLLECVAVVGMRVGLLLCRYENAEEYSVGKRFRFAVVDLYKCKNYPLNFVCMLPMKIDADGKSESVFAQIFGDQSVEQARALLTGALDTESDSVVKDELSRRLKLLEAKSTC